MLTLSAVPQRFSARTGGWLLSLWFTPVRCAECPAIRWRYREKECYPTRPSGESGDRRQSGGPGRGHGDLPRLTSAYADVQVVKDAQKAADGKAHWIQDHLVQNITASQPADGKRRKSLTTYALDASRLRGPSGKYETALSFGLSRSEKSTRRGRDLAVRLTPSWAKSDFRGLNAIRRRGGGDLRSAP